MSVSRRTFVKTGVGTAAAAAAVGGTAPAASASTLVGTSTATTASTVYGVSTAVAEITPSAVGAASRYLGGYAVNSRIATAVARPLYTRCLVIRDAGRPVVLVTADVLAFPRSMHQAIRSAVVQAGVASGDFLLTAAHTHSGPVLDQRLDPYVSYDLAGTDLSNVDTYSMWLVNTIVSLVKTALAQTPVQCTLSYAVDASAVGYNREGYPYTDPAVPVMTATPVSGSSTPYAIVFGYACHPVSRGRDLFYDSDYPGIVRSRLEARFPGTTAFFLTGAAGDQNPVVMGGEVSVSAQGGQIYRSVLRGVLGGGRPLNGSIATQYSEIALPFDLGQEPISTLRATYAARVAADPNGTNWTGRHAAEMVAQIDGNTLPSSMPLPLQMWTFTGGTPLRLAAVGGEPVSGYAVNLKSALGGSDALWFAGYSNEIQAYIPSQEMLVAGGYAAGWSVSPTCADWLGSTMYYGWPCRFLPGTGGIESTLINAVKAMAA